MKWLKEVSLGFLTIYLSGCSLFDGGIQKITIKYNYDTCIGESLYQVKVVQNTDVLITRELTRNLMTLNLVDTGRVQIDIIDLRTQAVVLKKSLLMLDENEFYSIDLLLNCSADTTEEFKIE